MKAFLSLLKSEHLEHRAGQLWTPVIVSAILLVLLLGGMLYEGSMLINVTLEDTNVDVRSVGDVLEAIRTDLGPEKAKPVLQAIAFSSTYIALLPVLLIAALASYFIMLSSMHSERADRSVLFWKSMPVSDLKVAVAKFLSSSLGTLLFAAAVGIATALITAICYAVAGSTATATPEWQSAIHPAVIGSTALLAIATCLFYVLWAAPVYGWILLASAWAPRSPLLYTAIPPVAIGILEVLTTRSGSWLMREIGTRVSGSMLHIDLPLGNVLYSPSGLAGMLMNQIATMAASAASPRFWLGLVFTVLCIWGTSEIRRRRIA